MNPFYPEPDYASFKYTEVSVKVGLLKCLSDFDERKYAVDIGANEYFQAVCYIGTQKIENLRLKRSQNNNPLWKEKVTSWWELTFIIDGGKNQEEVLQIIEDICSELSLQLIMQDTAIFNYGVKGFSFLPMDVKRKYAKEAKIFGEIDINRYGIAIMSDCKRTLKRFALDLPCTGTLQRDEYKAFRDAFLTGISSGDVVGRFILLYYLFEMIYKSEGYQRTHTAAIEEGWPDRSRSFVLLHYLRNELHIYSYVSKDESIPLKQEILKEIIDIRNDLAHRADRTKVNMIMYEHLVPILKEVLKSMKTCPTCSSNHSD